MTTAPRTDFVRQLRDEQRAQIEGIERGINRGDHRSIAMKPLIPSLAEKLKKLNELGVYVAAKEAEDVSRS